jgi:hypothetical protein
MKRFFSSLSIGLVFAAVFGPAAVACLLVPVDCLFLNDRILDYVASLPTFRVLFAFIATPLVLIGLFWIVSEIALRLDANSQKQE